MDATAIQIARRLREVTKNEAIESYEELKEMPCNEASLSRVGLNALDFFFLQYRIKARTKRHISFYEAIRDREYYNHLIELVVRYKKKPRSSYEPNELLRAQYYAFQLYYGTINQFRPTIAKWIYTLLKPKVGILDFSAGWGGRAIAAMSMGIPYIGIDANKNLEVPYRNMIQTYAHTAPITMIFEPSEQVRVERFEYDLIFTSPPYFMIEEYEKMPAYESKQNFLNTFFVPVIHRVWNHLLPGGNMALNMPEEMYDAIKDFLPRIKRQLELPLINRHPTNAVKGSKLGSKDKERHEWIYVWHKQKK